MAGDETLLSTPIQNQEDWNSSAEESFEVCMINQSDVYDSEIQG